LTGSLWNFEEMKGNYCKNEEKLGMGIWIFIKNAQKKIENLMEKYIWPSIACKIQQNYQKLVKFTHQYS